MKNKWISLLLSLLGFAAAGCEEARVEYGSPYATYTLKGKVTDMNGKAISGIRVDAAGRSYTDEEGTFSCTGDGMYGIPHTIEVHLQDVDGTDNGGLFADKHLSVTFQETDRVEGTNAGWYEGIYEITGFDVTLEEYKEEKNLKNPNS